MNISAALIGLPQAGKTTLFSAISGLAYQRVLEMEAAAGVARSAVPVPDERADALAQLVKPQRIVRIVLDLVDLAPEVRPSGTFISGMSLNTVAQCDLLVAVVRHFEDPAIPHPLARLDPIEDLQNLLAELLFIDLDIVDRRLRRIDEQIKKVKLAEREALKKEHSLLLRIRDALEASRPIRALDLAVDDVRRIRGYQFLSAKPIVALFNTSEDRLGEAADLAAGAPVPSVAVAAKLESETIGIPEHEADELLRALGITLRARLLVPELCFRSMNLVRFYTFNPEEVRVWAVPHGTTALEAAGEIHSDLQRGFIRAEVVRFEDLLRFGSLAEARKHGALRVEGRNYVVQDGDVLHILFSV